MKMFKNQRGSFYGNEMWWMMLICVLGVIILPPIAQMATYGIEEGWARYTAPAAPEPPIDFWGTGLNVLIAMGYLVGGCIALLIAVWIFVTLFNIYEYFVTNKNEPNKGCRFYGHQYIDRSSDREDDLIMDDGERFHRSIDLWCPRCGKEHGKHAISETYNKETGEIKNYE